MKTTNKILLLTVTSFLFAETMASAQTCGTSQVTYSGYTSSYIPKWNVTSGCISNSSIFDNGNVGIGTTTPGNKLQINGDIKSGATGMNGNIKLARTVDGANIGILSIENGSGFRIQTGGGSSYITFQTNTITDAVRVIDNGNTGIGTTTPVSKLDVEGGISIGSTYSGTTAAPVNGAIVEGNVGIGTSGPGASTKLQVSGSALFTGGSQDPGDGTPAGVRIGYSASNFGFIQSMQTGVAYKPLALQPSGGNLGIGTTSPLAKLHLNNGSILFDGTTGATPTSGAGTRMMWIPAKGAFRAGIVTGTQWNDGSIGLNSVAFGTNTTASGSYSSAFGAGSIASGEYSTAFITGFASGDYSFATGYNATASGPTSIAFGQMTTASGGTSAAFGISTTAQAYASFVTGRYNVISGTGGSWVATDPLFVIGNGASAGAPSNALTVLKNGNVGIGTALTNNPNDYKLAVNGTIGAKAVKVEITSTTWPDYVFKNEYKNLKTLKEIEQYVKENGHLPEIPTAKEIETNGADIGELLKLQMQKIEELTLYLIEQDKKIIDQNRRIETLEKNK